MRNICCAVAFLFTGMLAGCQTQWETRTYSLGPKPKAAYEAIDQITTDQIKQHADQVMKETPTGGRVPVLTVIEDEGVAVVKTTPEGHRRIRVALEELREASIDKY